MAYLTHSERERQSMLDVIGVRSVEELFTAIPSQLRNPSIDLPPQLSEQELVEELTSLSKANFPATKLDGFLGAGTYPRYIPAIVKATISRPEFYTAYTPYQAEASQGTLQTVFEFQSMVAELYGMDVANASLYDGPTAAAEAVLLCVGQTKRRRVVMSRDLHPDVLQVVKTFAHAHDIDLVTQPADAITIDTQTAAILLPQPSFLGFVTDQRELVAAAHEAGALAIAYADPFACSVLESPGAIGFDVAVGDGQQFGIPMSFGGPHLGLIALKTPLLRRIPGRLVGETTDKAGRRAFTLTLQAREQHIRREKATSNICTNHALMALAATAYLGYMGAAGVRKLAEVSIARAHKLAAGLTAHAGWRLPSTEPYLWEFPISVGGSAQQVARLLRDQGIVAGLPLGQFYPQRDDQLLISCTEMTSPKSIERYIAAASRVASVKVPA